MATMPRIDHVAVVTQNPDVPEDERRALRRRLEEDGVGCEERDHEIEAITYRGGDDARPP